MSTTTDRSLARTCVSASRRFATPTRVAMAAAALGVVGLVGLAVAARLRPDPGLVVGGVRIRLVERVQTGHQRAERVTFLQGGRLVAATCPRYDRLVIFEIGSEPRRLRAVLDTKLPGKPVGLAEAADGLYVLQRPAGDARHIEPGFCQKYDVDGRPLGPRWEVGYDPDDIALIDNGRIALVLLSGNSEGESNRPDPELVAFDLRGEGPPRITARVRLGGAETDPMRLSLSARQSHAAIVVRGGTLIGVDLARPAEPSLTGSVSLAGKPRPALSSSGDDVIVVPDESLADVAPLPDPSAPSAGWRTLVSLDPDAGQLVFHGARQAAPLGRLTLRGPGGIGQVRLCGLAYSADRDLIAVADRSGGLHVLERTEATPARGESPPNPARLASTNANTQAD